MLTIYTYKVPKPTECFDMSAIPLDELTDTLLSIVTHQSTGHVWFGYLDGWMLTPREEVLLRKVLRKFSCSCVSFFPMAFSQAWKNEIDIIYTDPGHGHSRINHDGRIVCNKIENGHEHTCSGFTAHGEYHQNRETRGSETRSL